MWPPDNRINSMVVPTIPAPPSCSVGTFHRDQNQFVNKNGILLVVSDDNIEWNLHLAMLGLTLCAVEDYL